MSGAAVRTTCPYCGVGCGVLAQVLEGVAQISGDPGHPANRGALCSKGGALGETLALEGRLLRPRIGGAEAGWDAALELVAARFRETIERHGPESVGFYVSGQLLTEDYYVANKLMKGFIGSAAIDTNSRLCMASAVAAHKRAFGEDVVPVTYEDLEEADMIVLAGSNTAWCHPVLHRRIVEAKERRPSLGIVVIDPRRTPTCDGADLHLQLRSGTDVLLFNGLLSWLAGHGHLDRAFLDRHTRGAARALGVADNTAGDLAAVARGCGLAAADLESFYRRFAAAERTVTLFSQGINQSSAGTDKANAIINVHLATGRIGRAGMGPFSITGQPNAMGGREVGGLANALAAHLDLESEEHRRWLQVFWQSPRMAQRPGPNAVALFEAVHRGRIKALWVMATNPAASLPNADRARAALRRCEFLVVSDVVAHTDTADLAHVLLPAAAWGEKDGTVTNSERLISRQRRFLPLPGEARPDWQIICEVARRMGFGRGFDYASAAEIFDEHARSSALSRRAARAFDLRGLAGLGEAGYQALAPTRWPVPPTDASAHAGANAVAWPDSSPCRPLSGGRFHHPDARARLVPTMPRPPRFALDAEYPLVLNTGRIRDQWHTMTRTGRSARLASHLPEPFVDMHPADARHFGLRAGRLARIVTRWGHMVARVRISGELTRGALFVPIHWTGANASNARVGALVSPSVDPVSGEPEFKSTPARLEPFVVNWYGVLAARGPVSLDTVSYWTRAEAGAFRRYEIAGRAVPGRWPAWARALLRAETQADWIDYEDAHTGTYRAALLRDDRLEACLFVGPGPESAPESGLAALFDRPALSVVERAGLLSGRLHTGTPEDSGSMVCACAGVGRRAIEAVITAGCRNLSEMGRRLGAGMHCGTCRPELRRLIDAAAEFAP